MVHNLPFPAYPGTTHGVNIPVINSCQNVNKDKLYSLIVDADIVILFCCLIIYKINLMLNDVCKELI
jgi:hypothetical protein